MRKTRIFVSSTCYDLGPVRESIRDLLKESGHEAVLSEFHSFPIDPFTDTISNCCRNVRENTDLFLLLVGDTYGSVDLKSGRSVTNLEYDTAIAEEIPAFIFVKKSLTTILPIWRANKEMKVPGVPDNRVFAFVDEIYSRGRWVYTFERVDEIKQILNEQLSVIFRDLLERRAAGKIDPLLSFRGESSRVKNLALDKPDYWEYLLSAELFRNRFSKTFRRYKKLREGFMHVPLKSISGPDFFDWTQDHFSNILSIVNVIGKQYTVEFKESLGPPGISGNAEMILSVVNEIDSLLNQLIDCERELISHKPPDLFKGLQENAVGLINVIFETLETLPSRLEEPFKDGKPPEGKAIDLMLVFPSPDFSKYEAELSRLEEAILSS